MGRIRTVKPEFFKHEDLFDAERASGLPLRLAFAGLWTCCDREGRFEWRPRSIKTDVMPYDDVDFAAVLDALAAHGFVRRYTVAGKDYGCVPGFARHQLINPRETPSKLPSPPEDDGNPPEPTREPRVSDASSTRQCNARGEGEGEREGEREGKSSVEADASTAAGAAEGDDGDLDPKKALFERGIPFLLRHGVPNEATARSFIGKCRQFAKDNTLTDMDVLDAFTAFRRTDNVEPRGWIMAALQARASPNPQIDTASLMAGALADLRAKGTIQ